MRTHHVSPERTCLRPPALAGLAVSPPLPALMLLCCVSRLRTVSFPARSLFVLAPALLVLLQGAVAGLSVSRCHFSYAAASGCSAHVCVIGLYRPCVPEAVPGLLCSAISSPLCVWYKLPAKKKVSSPRPLVLSRRPPALSLLPSCCPKVPCRTLQAHEHVCRMQDARPYASRVRICCHVSGCRVSLQLYNARMSEVDIRAAEGQLSLPLTHVSSCRTLTTGVSMSYKLLETLFS
jgi:hypothetical protein